MPSLEEALGSQQQPSAQQNPLAALNPQDRLKLLQAQQVQQAAQQFPSRLSQSLDLNSHVPPPQQAQQQPSMMQLIAALLGSRTQRPVPMSAGGVPMGYGAQQSPLGRINAAPVANPYPANIPTANGIVRG